MFATTAFFGYHMMPMAQPGFLAVPCYWPAAIIQLQRPVEFLPQGNCVGNGNFSAQSSGWESSSPQGPSTMSSSPCYDQESSSGYSSDNENGLVQYHYQEARPTGKRLPIFEAIHQKGLKLLQDRQRVPENGQQEPCSEEKSKIPEEKKLPRRFKTVLCKHFMVGNCRNGDECRYAHGVEELRVPKLP